MFYKMRIGLKKKDGNAIFFKRSRFTFFKRFYLNLLITPFDNYDADDELKQMDYPSICLFLILEDNFKVHNNGEKNRILIINNHVVFKKYLGHVKLGMLTFILKAIEEIKSMYSIDQVFFCGDFNFVPNSMLYDFVANRDISLDCCIDQFSNQYYLDKAFKDISLKDKLDICNRRFIPDHTNTNKPIDEKFANILINSKIILPDNGSEEIKIHNSGNGDNMNRTEIEKELRDLSKRIGFKSAYASFNQKYKTLNNNIDNLSKMNHLDLEVDNINYENLISQYAQELPIPVDYIWYSTINDFNPVKILLPPTIEHLESLPDTCPIGNFGSDHFSISADFGQFKFE